MEVFPVKEHYQKCSQENVHFISLIIEIFSPSQKAHWIVSPSLETSRLFFSEGILAQGNKANLKHFIRSLGWPSGITT